MKNIVTFASSLFCIFSIFSMGMMNANETNEKLEMPKKENIAIFAFSFGQGANASAGDTNRGLAWVIQQIVEENNNHTIKVFAQHEIISVLNEKSVQWYYNAIPQDGYLSTEGVLKQFVKKIKEDKTEIDRIFLVAQEDHIHRCKKLTELSGLPIIIPSHLYQVPWVKEFSCDPNGYSKNSTQKWTAERSLFLNHEKTEVGKLDVRIDKLTESKSCLPLLDQLHKFLN